MKTFMEAVLILPTGDLLEPHSRTFRYYNVVPPEYRDPQVADDGLPTPEVGAWAEEKYRLIALYDRLFSTGMKRKWDQRVYIDLYAGAGYSRTKEKGTIMKGSPLIALTVPDAFDKYIFCEENPELLEALKARANRIAPGANISYVLGNCDAEIDRIFREIPTASSVLTLCFLDPFTFGLKFETLRKLSRARIDFLVLLAVYMDANRNYDHYVDGQSTKIDEALGSCEWRDRWRAVGVRRGGLGQFLAREFARSMTALGYLDTPLNQMRLVRAVENNAPLYYLALFSRHETAFKLWKQGLKYSTDQMSFLD
jgi:three-Cys-motif partner protein